MKWIKLAALVADIMMVYISYTDWRAACDKCGQRHCDGSCDS